MRAHTQSASAGAGVRAGDNTPGAEFAAAVTDLRSAGDVVVAFGIHLPAAFPLFATRPRYPVRHLLKTAAVADGPATFVHEPHRGGAGGGARATSGTSYATTPEAGFAPCLASTPLTDVTVRVPLADGLLEHPALLASNVDFRVLVRLSVAENEALLHGTADGAITGLLRLPGTRARRFRGALDEAVVRTAAEVEETGGSCDGIVAHPETYWELVRTGMLERLAVAGVVVSRTRMIPKDTLLFGDFRAAFTLLLPGVAHLRLCRGAGADGGDVVEAATRIGLAVHLPQHLIALSQGAGGA